MSSTMTAAERVKQVTGATDSSVTGGIAVKPTNDRKPGDPVTVLSVEAREFESTVDSKLISTIQLGEIINGMFRPFMRDYVGSNIQLTTIRMPISNAMGMNGFVDPNQQHNVGYVDVPRFEVELYFQNAANTRATEYAISNIVERGKEFSSNKQADMGDVLAAKIAAMNSKAKPGKNYTLSQDTKDMLDEFIMYPYRRMEKIDYVEQQKDANGNTVEVKKSVRVSKPDWDGRLIYELTDSSIANPSMYGTYLKVTNLDLVAILYKIWGRTNSIGHRVDYDVRAIRPLSGYGNNIPVNALNALLKIDRLDCEEVDRMSKTLGMMTVIGSLPINRG